MGHYKGRLAEILLEAYQNATARLSCSVEAIPRPGQYLQLWAPHDELSVLPVSAFPAGEAHIQGHQALLPVQVQLPQNWQPGTELQLRGPLGRGFELPKHAKRVLLAALAGSPGRLLPLATLALKQGTQIVMCSPGPANDKLPIEVEVREMAALRELLRWADYLAVDVRVEDLAELHKTLGVDEKLPPALTAEALVLAPMPCGRLAKCSVCAVSTNGKDVLLCEQGPVVSINHLLSEHRLINR